MHIKDHFISIKHGASKQHAICTHFVCFLVEVSDQYQITLVLYEMLHLQAMVT